MAAVDTPPHVEEILGPHPELLAYWREFMARPCMTTPGYSGTVKRYLDPIFLEKVVDEHVRLIERQTEQPGPELAAAIEAALDLNPDVRQERARHLASPWWRADSYNWGGIAEYHDPVFLRGRAESYQRHADPFSKESIRLREFLAVLKAGGTFDVTETASGRIVETFTTPGSREGSAGRN